MMTRKAVYGALLISLLITATSLWANSVRIFSLSADSWARPRAGQVIPDFEPVRMAIAYWETGTDAAILLSYPGEDSGELWASELKDWLISLGIPSDYILLSPGLQAKDEIHILVGTRQELNR
jgi:hypothetical protein